MITPRRQEIELTKIKITTEYESEETYAEDSIEPQRQHSTLGRVVAKVWTVLSKLSSLYSLLLSLFEKIGKDC